MFFYYTQFAQRRANVGDHQHLLICERCRERLASWDMYIAAMQRAAAHG